jgi:peptidoglycan/LPS O-acetylase OafA/YrhL
VSLPLALAVSVAASLVVAELFYRYVEQPSHRLSMAVGSAVGRRTRRDALGIPDTQDAPNRRDSPPVRVMAEAGAGRRG